MQLSLLAALLALSTPAASIPGEELNAANEAFRQYWGTDFEWKFDELPTEGAVTKSRVPYSGYIYPDTGGGTSHMLQKYDRAFNGGRYLATAHEQWDTTAFQEPSVSRGGFFGRRMVTVMQTPGWHGHCNGWAAAAIRHAEPQQSVQRNGVVFSPADIKGLLAEIYIYNEIAELAGSGYSLNAGALHATLANWLGRGSHALGMEADPGEQKWNYPVYGFNTSYAKRSDREVEVKLNIAYAKDSNGEFQQSPRYHSTKYFHYLLNLDAEGRIVGGSYYRDSSIIDLLWVPLRPKQARRPGHERGNPYVDVDKVLAIWRDSVSEEIRQKWPVIDPPAEDRLADVSSFTSLVPLQDPSAVAAEEALAETVEPESAADPSMESAPDPVPEPSADEASEPATEPVTEPLGEPATAPAGDVATEPAAEPAAATEAPETAEPAS